MSETSALAHSLVRALPRSKPARYHRSTMPTTREVLDATIALEKQSMALYARFAKIFASEPALQDFWFGMARDEARHVGALDLVTTVLDQEAMLDKPSPISLEDATIVRLRDAARKVAGRRDARNQARTRARDRARSRGDRARRSRVGSAEGVAGARRVRAMPAPAGPRPRRAELHDRAPLGRIRRCSRDATRWSIVTPRRCATRQSGEAARGRGGARDGRWLYFRAALRSGQIGKAPDSGSGDCRFESYLLSQ